MREKPDKWVNSILQGDSLEVLKTLPDESIDCVMTSPPYWALRDYCVSGQLGLEPTFQEYIDKLCNIFDEVKRVLKKEGTCWVNLGTTFGEIEVQPISEKDRAWLAALIDGEGCIQIHKQIRKNSVPSYQADISVGMMDKQMVEYAHKLTKLGTVNLQKRGVWDWSVRGQEAGKLARLIYPFLMIKNEQAKVVCAICENTKKLAGKTNGKNTKPENLKYREELFILNKKLNQRKKVQVNLPNPLKLKSTSNPKCDLQIPSRFAIEMTNRGWILRNEIIWYKPNCMPSSAKDRFTVDFEKVFFFVKNKKYWFETQYEDYAPASDVRYRQALRAGRSYNTKEPYKTNMPYAGSVASRGDDADGLVVGGNNEGRNKRCVWKICPKPYAEAHFAVYPKELCETPIKAGCPEGGIVLDPFFGSGTTGEVARYLGRNYVGIELNPEYIKLAEKRLSQQNLF